MTALPLAVAIAPPYKGVLLSLKDTLFSCTLYPCKTLSAPPPRRAEFPLKLLLAMTQKAAVRPQKE